MNRLSSKQKSVNRTFRLDEEIISILRSSAERRHLSMNLAVREMIRKAANDELMEDLEMEYFPTILITKMMNVVPENKVSELARFAAKNYAHQFIWGITKDVSADAIIKSYEYMATKYRKILTFEHVKEGLTHTMKIRHSRGPNWSKFYGETIRDAFWELVGIQVDVRWTQNEVVGTFSETAKSRPHEKRTRISESVKQIA